MSWRLPLGMLAGRGGGQTGPVDVAATSPATLTTDLVLWLKADSYVGSDGDAVTTWADSSGNGYDATQATAGKKPTYKTNIWNSLPVMRFDGGDGLGTAAIDLSAENQMTWYIVASATDLTVQMIAELTDNANTNAGAAYMLVDASSRLEVTTKGDAGFDAWTSLNTFEDGTGTARVLHGVFDMATATRHETQGGVDGDTTGRRGTYNNNTGNFANAVFNIGCRDADASAAATSLFLTGDIAEIIVYQTRHTAAQRWGVERYLAERYNITAWSQPFANLMFEGDSITEGGNSYFSNSYPQRLVNRLKNKVAWRNPAISGQDVDDAVADFSTQISPESAYANWGSKNIATCWVGTNDMVSVGGNQTAAATLTEYYAYLDSMRAANFETIAFTVIPRDDAAAPADMEAKRIAFNADVLSNWASHADALCDPTTSALFDVEADSLNTTYYDADKVHPNVTGLRIISGMVGSVLETTYGVEQIVPTDVSGLALWLDATQITPVADGTAVAQWDDSSGSGNHAVQADGAKQPIYKTSIINSLPVVRWQGTNDCMTVAAGVANGATGITILSVVTSSVTGADQAIIEASANFNNETNAFMLYITSGNVWTMSCDGGAGYANATMGGFLTTANVRSATVARAKTAREAIAWSNGVIGANSTTAQLSSTFGNHVLNIGSRNNGAAIPFTGDIAELMIFNRVLTGGERGRLEEYLAYKWGSF